MELNLVLEEIEKLDTNDQRLLIDIIKKKLIKVKDLDFYQEIDNNFELKNVDKQKSNLFDGFNNLSDFTFNEWDNEIDKVYDEL